MKKYCGNLPGFQCHCHRGPASQVWSAETWTRVKSATNSLAIPRFVDYSDYVMHAHRKKKESGVIK